MALAYPLFPPLRENVCLALHTDVRRLADLQILTEGYGAIGKDTKAHAEELQRCQGLLPAAMNTFYRALCNPRCVVLVAEAPPKLSSISAGPSTAETPSDETHPPAEREVICGIIYRLPLGSVRYGQFVLPVDEALEVLTAECNEAPKDSFTWATETAEDKFFKNALFLRQVVHLLHRGRHPCRNSMIQWGLDLCDMDKIPCGMVADCVANAARRFGFEQFASFTIRTDAGGLEANLLILIRQPQGHSARDAEQSERAAKRVEHSAKEPRHDAEDMDIVD